jgi:phage tail-like protein
MQVVGLKAEPDPRGGSIVLTWTNPSDTALAGIKILRREFTLPEIPGDYGSSFEIHDDPAAQPGISGTFTDTGAPRSSLRGETVYYYAVVARDSSAAQFPSFVSAMATSPFQSGSYLYENLPGIYRTYDTALPAPGAVADPADERKGQLLRFIEMFGLQFDQLRSFTDGMRNFFDARRVDGNLLPLLAQWIGWQPDFTLSFAKQRNEVAYAPSFYRTAGVPANLRAMVNRVSTWDTQIKEFAHNIFRTSEPEQLALYATKRKGGVWQPEELVTQDVGHEGRPAVLLTADGPQVFFHTRQDVRAGEVSPCPRWQILYKSFGQDGWQPAHPVTSGDTVNRHPAVVQRADGSVWLFWAAYESRAARLTPGLKLQILSTGRAATRARIQGTLSGPFSLADGDPLKLVITSNGLSFTRTVTVRTEDFGDITQVTAEELAAVLNRELPFIDARLTTENFLVIESQLAGSTVSLQVLPSTVAAKLGIAAPFISSGGDALSAQMVGSLGEPFALSPGDQLTILRNGDVARTVTFQASDFLNIGTAKAQEVAMAINSVMPGAATAAGARIMLHSNGSGEPALLSVNVSESSAAPKLGFGVVPPALPAANTQPFSLSAGEQLLLRGNANVTGTVVFQPADFLDLGNARASEVVAVINNVLPGAASTQSGLVSLSPFAVFDPFLSSAAAKLGLGTSPSRRSPADAEPFALSPGDQLVISGKADFARTVTFTASEFANIAAATAAEVAVVLNSEAPGLASAPAGQVLLTPLVGVDATAGGAAINLGLGTPDESEPTVFEDAAKNLWLFWSSRRSGDWKIWFSRFDGTSWGAPRQLTSGSLPDREPAALFDAASGRIWVFWSRKKPNGLWNIFFRTTTKLDFSTLADADWAEVELTPVPADPPGSYNNREPVPVQLAADALELYFSSDRSNGWNTWSKPVSSVGQGSDAQVTSGQFTRRSPAPLVTGANEVTIWFRSNKTQIYSSSLYPSAQTVDARYSGSTTADTRNPARLSLRRNIRDIQRYTYHAPPQDSQLTPTERQVLEEKRLYSRDTVGVYLVPDTNDEQLILRNQALIAESLPKFLPIQVRVVFLIDQAFSELVYDYAGSGASAPLIGEQLTDVVLSEAFAAIADSHADRANFKFVRTLGPGVASGGLPDLSVHPPDLSFRMPITGVGEGA